MEPTSNQQLVNPGEPAKKRPLLLSVLCFFSWVYYGIMALLFLLALLYSGWITGIINQYVTVNSRSTVEIAMLFLSMFALHAIALSGVILLWKNKRTGYYLFSIPTIGIAVFHLFRPEISWYSTAVYAILVILFGLFYRRMKNLPAVSH